MKHQGRINGERLKVWRSKERKAMLFFAACYASTGSKSLTTSRFMMWSICFATCGWIVGYESIILAVQWTCYGVTCLFCFWAVYGVKWCWLSYAWIWWFLDKWCWVVINILWSDLLFGLKYMLFWSDISPNQIIRLKKYVELWLIKSLHHMR